jgi:hypothetical protein
MEQRNAQENLHALMQELLQPEGNTARAEGALDHRAALVPPLIVATYLQMDLPLREDWERRLASWEGLIPHDAATAVLAEAARVQRMAIAEADARTLPADRRPPRLEVLARVTDVLEQTPPPPLSASFWDEPPPPMNDTIGEWAHALARLQQSATTTGAEAALAREALRRAWGAGSQGDWDTTPNLPLMYRPDQVVEQLTACHKAQAAWDTSHYPLDDLITYLRPVPPATHRLPPSGTLVATAAQMQSEAEQAGGTPWPMIYPLGPADRAHAMRAAWTNTTLPVPDNWPGIPLYPLVDDPTLQWGGHGHPLGLVAAIALRPTEILSLGRPDRAEEQRKFHLWQQAARQDDSGHHAFLDAAQAAGIAAIARYDLRAGRGTLPQEVVVLRHATPRIRFIREQLSP